MSEKVNLNVKAYIRDFVRGLSEEELQERYSLTHSQIQRVTGVLKKRGDITQAELDRRRANLKIRFGDEKSRRTPKKVHTGVSIDLDSGIVLHCPSCGASVDRHAERCEYCKAHLDFSLKGKTKHCPHCYQKIPAESRFCIVCAKPAKFSPGEGTLRDDRLCPRCETAMHSRNVGDFPVLGCVQCDGLFIPHDTFEMMQDNSKRIIEATGLSSGGEAELRPELGTGYIRCPACRHIMNRKNFAGSSGVIVDICGQHGVWFDAGELEKIMSFLARGGLQKARRKELQKLKDEQKFMKYYKQGRTTEAHMLMSPMDVDVDPYQDRHSLDLADVVGEIFSLFKK
jgi:Zn-finger nucleic acid-binding protein